MQEYNWSSPLHCANLFVNDNFNHIAKDKHQDFTKRMYVFADAIDRAIDEIEHKKSTSDSD